MWVGFQELVRVGVPGALYGGWDGLEWLPSEGSHQAPDPSSPIPPTRFGFSSFLRWSDSLEGADHPIFSTPPIPCPPRTFAFCFKW